jgi:DNA-binding response OmpR family regulator
MSDKPLILVVDQNARNRELLAQFLQREGYEAVAGGSVTEAEGLLAQHRRIALGLVDIAGLGGQVWTYCGRLRQEEIPFVVLAPATGQAARQEGLACGAAGVLVKPLSMNGLRLLLRVLLERPG